MRYRVLLALPLILGLLAVPAFAHHTFSVEYDASKCSSMTGTLTKVDWENPHVYFHVDLKDANNQVDFLELRGSIRSLSKEERDREARFPR